MSKLDNPNVVLYKGENGRPCAGVSDDAKLALVSLGSEQILAVQAFFDSFAVESEMSVGRGVFYGSDADLVRKLCLMNGAVEGVKAANKEFVQFVAILRSKSFNGGEV